MQIKLVINQSKEEEEEDLIVVSLDSSSTISSWLIDYYFTKIYSKQIRISNKSIQPSNIIGVHDMFIISQIIQPTISSMEFSELCKKKFQEKKNDLMVENYNNYLIRCGLIDIIDLFHQCKFQSCMKIFYLNINNVKNEIDRLFLNYLIEIALEHSIYDDQTEASKLETPENIMKLFEKEQNQIEQTISRNYLKHTLCTYLLLLLDTRNEHALIHCLATPARTGLERRTIIELRRLTKLSQNECLTIYQILLTFLRRKELILSRSSSSQSEASNQEDQSFLILEKSYLGIKEFFDFIEQLQMTIEENEHAKIPSIETFRKLMLLISKQLRKDTSLNRCDGMMKEIMEEFCQCFQTTLPLMDCTSPIRSASSGGTLAGRRFLRSVAYLCAKQIIDLPILLTINDHYDSPSTGLRKATSSRLLKSPLTPIPIVMEPISVVPTEEKVVEIPIESVFMWQKKEEQNSTSNNKRFRRRKSQRCLDLSTIQEKTLDSDDLTNQSTDSNIKISSGSTRQPLGEIDINSFNHEDRQLPENEKSPNPTSFSLVNDTNKENLPMTIKKRSIVSTNIEPPRKKQKKISPKPLITGQKMITNFFQSKT